MLIFFKYKYCNTLTCFLVVLNFNVYFKLLKMNVSIGTAAITVVEQQRAAEEQFDTSKRRTKSFTKSNLIQ